jgi:hypothetical protein
MEWNRWGMGGCVSTVIDSIHSYAFLGEVGLHVVTDGALEGCIFIGCCEHLQRAARLVELLRGKIDAEEFARIEGDELVRKQNGIIRCNCIDCIDRSSIVQFMIARDVFATWLREIGQEGAAAEFGRVWSENADAAARQYAGSPALRTDFTRTGKRTTKGMILDAACAFQRYWANNMTDGKKQDAYDAVTQLYRAGNRAFVVVTAALYLLIVFWVIALARGRPAARENVRAQRLNAVNRPSFRDAEIRADQGI